MRNPGKSHIGGVTHRTSIEVRSYFRSSRKRAAAPCLSTGLRVSNSRILGSKRLPPSGKPINLRAGLRSPGGFPGRKGVLGPQNLVWSETHPWVGWLPEAFQARGSFALTLISHYSYNRENLVPPGPRNCRLGGVWAAAPTTFPEGGVLRPPPSDRAFGAPEE